MAVRNTTPDSRIEIQDGLALGAGEYEIISKEHGRFGFNCEVRYPDGSIHTHQLGRAEELASK